MSITLFSGIPRSGKTYKMVCEAWKLKDKYFIIHNIVGFKNEVLNGYGFDWVEYINGANPDKAIIDPDVFFSKDFQVKLAALINEKYNRPMLVIIDEANEWFDTHKKAIKLWLAYHGHLNQQVYLVAHASTNIPRVYRSFVESEYRAKSSAFLFIPWYFFYNRILGGERSGYIIEKKDQKIFDLYKSADIKESKKKRSYFIPLVIAGAVLLFLAFAVSPKYLFNHVKKKDVKEANDEKKTPGSKAVSELQEQFKKNDRIVIEATVPFDKKFAYVGNIDNEIILEDRKSGKQYPLSRIEGGFKLVKLDRANSCTVFAGGNKLFTVYNFDRFVEKVAAPAAIQEISNNDMMTGALSGARRMNVAPDNAPAYQSM